MIFVECKPDAALVRRITGLPRRHVMHELKGKYEVCKRIGAQGNCKALIDEDPGSPLPVYLQTLGPPGKLSSKGVIVFDDRRRNNRVVVLRPKLGA